MSIVIRPITVTPAMLIDSSVPDAAKPAWVAETDYLVGVQVSYLGIDYESVEAPNVGNVPSTSPLYWAATGPSNRWRMFDPFGEIKTVSAGPLVVKIRPGTRIDSMALRGLRATSVDIVIREGEGGDVIFELTKDLGRTGVTSWYQYFFEPFTLLEAFIVTGIPMSRQAVITVTINGGDTVAISDLVIGMAADIGKAEYGAQAGIVSYGRKDRTTTGGSRLWRGRYARRNSMHMFVPNSEKDRVFRTLADLRETPCLFQGAARDGFDLVTTFGTYEDFSIDIAYSSFSYLTIELLGFAEKTEPEGA